MLTPEFLASLPDAAVELSRKIEDDLLADAARRIAKMDGITETAAYQLWCREQSTAYRRDVIRALVTMTGKSPAVISEILLKAGREAFTADDAAIRAAGRQAPSIVGNEALNNILRAGLQQTQQLFVNLTRTTVANGRLLMPQSATRQFIAACDHAWYQISSGGFDYQHAIRSAVSEIAGAGITAVTYPSGHRDTLEVAVRRAVVTGANQTCSKLQLARADELDCEFFETSAHAGARPEHAEWQGRVFHRGGGVTIDGVFYPDFETVTGYGTGGGLCGWNCRHSFYPFWPGLSKRAYDAEELEKLNAKDVLYNGKLYTRYEAEQLQRAAERSVRKAKREYLATDSAGLSTSDESMRLAETRRRLADVLKQTGGGSEATRTGISGFGRSEASKAVWAAKRALTNATGQPILKVEKVKLHAAPNSITQRNSKKNGIERNYYDASGRQCKQIANSDHGNSKLHPYGEHGEHAHDYIYDADGNLIERRRRELNDNEREENADIL